MSELADLENAPVECDGSARLIIAVLARFEQSYYVYMGSVTNQDGKEFPKHLWVVWNDKIIDFTARLWLGDSAPHGIMDFDQVNHLYNGSEIHLPVPSTVLEAILKISVKDEMAQLKAKKV